MVNISPVESLRRLIQRNQSAFVEDSNRVGEMVVSVTHVISYPNELTLLIHSEPSEPSVPPLMWATRGVLIITPRISAAG